jgi:predicted GNAT superfamily acetyltransferase
MAPARFREECETFFTFIRVPIRHNKGSSGLARAAFVCLFAVIGQTGMSWMIS